MAGLKGMKAYQFMDKIQISGHSDMSAKKSEQKNDTNATMTATFSCCDWWEFTGCLSICNKLVSFNPKKTGFFGQLRNMGGGDNMSYTVKSQVRARYC